MIENSNPNDIKDIERLFSNTSIDVSDNTRTESSSNLLGYKLKILDFSGKGQKWDSVADVADLIRELQDFEKLDVLNLEGNSLGIEASEAISKALEKHSDLKYAKWKDLFTGRTKKEIPQCLMFLTNGLTTANIKLVELDLSDNAFGPVGMQELQNLLKCEVCYTLNELKLNNCGLGVQGGEMLAEAILQCFESSIEANHPLYLKHIFLGRNRLENKGANALAHVFKILKTLETISLPQNGIYYEGIHALATAFEMNKNLQEINLYDNTLTEKGAEYLGNAVSSLKYLKILNLGGCLIRSKGAYHLGNSLKFHSNIMLSINDAVSLFHYLENIESLHLLDVNGNKFGESGCEMLNSLAVEKNKHIWGNFDEDEGSSDEYSDDSGSTENNESETDASCNSMNSHKDKEIAASEEIIDNCEHAFSGLLSNPIVEKLLNISNNSSEEILHYVQTNSLSVDDMLLLFCHLSSLTSENKAFQENTSKLCTILLLHAFEKDPMAATNVLLINLGLIKSEDKTFKISWSLEACLLNLVSFMHHNTLPKFTKDTLQVFLSKPQNHLCNCRKSQHKLMELLFK